MAVFTPVSAAVGGVLIGLAAAGMLGLNGRITGVTGFLGGVLVPRSREDALWRAAFLLGMVASASVYLFVTGGLNVTVPRSLTALAVAGLLVGVGTGVSNGCTSGHGVCGNARLSPRSIVATLTFIAAGAGSVVVVSRLFGGAL
jgi:uncharacterized membrane protein YedE/YeeE